MRVHPADFELVAPGSLPAVLTLLAGEPGAWLPIAGGTDVMVQYSSGTLAARKLVSIGNLAELRRVEVLPDEIQIGAGSTYTDLRRHEIVTKEFSLLSSAASWTGGIANQKSRSAPRAGHFESVPDGARSARERGHRRRSTRHGKCGPGSPPPGRHRGAIAGQTN